MKRCQLLRFIYLSLLLQLMLIGPVFGCYWSGDTLSVRSTQLLRSIRHLHHEDVILLFPRLMETSPAVAFTVPCIPPVGAWDHNWLSSGYGLRRHPIQGCFKQHQGIDIAGPNQYVRATASGRVARVGWANGLGLHVVVDHGNSYQTIYGHLAVILCQAGQALDIGERIGVLGKTGQATGLHLHYAIKKSGRYVNPAPYLTVGLKLVTSHSSGKPTNASGR